MLDDQADIFAASLLISYLSFSALIHWRFNNDPLAELEAGKPVIKDLFRDLVIEIKGFKYQRTMKVLLSKQKVNKHFF